MPIYSFTCNACDKTFDQLYSTFICMEREKSSHCFSCPYCGSTDINQDIALCNHVFKCDGFYATDKNKKE